MSKQCDRIATVKLIVMGSKSYAIATVAELCIDVSFSLSSQRGVWQSDTLPKRGAKVMLSDIQCINGRWRAFKARLYSLNDESTQVKE